MALARALAWAGSMLVFLKTYGRPVKGKHRTHFMTYGRPVKGKHLTHFMSYGRPVKGKHLAHLMTYGRPVKGKHLTHFHVLWAARWREAPRTPLLGKSEKNTAVPVS